MAGSDGSGVDVMFFYEEDFCVFNSEVLRGLPDQAVEALADWDQQQLKKTTKSKKAASRS